MSSTYKAREQSWNDHRKWAPTDTVSDCLMELLSRVEALEPRCAESVPQPEAETVTIADAPPLAAAPDHELMRIWNSSHGLTDSLRAVYNFGCKHGAAQPAPANRSATASPAAQAAMMDAVAVAAAALRAASDRQIGLIDHLSHPKYMEGIEAASNLLDHIADELDP
jgi:hypothetical protein